MGLKTRGTIWMKPCTVILNAFCVKVEVRETARSVKLSFAKSIVLDLTRTEKFWQIFGNFIHLIISLSSILKPITNWPAMHLDQNFLDQHLIRFSVFCSQIIFAENGRNFFYPGSVEQFKMRP